MSKKSIEHIFSVWKANLVAIPVALLASGILIPPFLALWDYDTFKAGKEVFSDNFLLILLSGIIIHEGLHGITWAYFAGFKAIRFGIQWKSLTPYCHCIVPLKVKHYRLGGAMPLTIMGVAPCLLAYPLASGFLLCYGILFIIAASGDILMLYGLRKLQKSSSVQDHPKKMGFIEIVPATAGKSSTAERSPATIFETVHS